MALSGKTALITGCSALHGIGRAIAMRLAEDGARVIVTDVPGEMQATLLDGLVADIGRIGADAITLPLDITDAARIDACITEIMAQDGRIDILVNNAGSLAGSDHFMSTTPDQWQASFAVNLLGPMMMAQAVIPGMKANGGGRIINIGSIGSLGAEPGFGAYTTMKHGLIGLSNTIAAEFGPDGILCNTICPGYIATDMHMAANTRIAAETGTSIEATKQRRYAHVALRDAGTPQDVADAAAYLAGPQSKYVTGIALPVTGGVPFGI